MKEYYVKIIYNNQTQPVYDYYTTFIPNIGDHIIYNESQLVVSKVINRIINIKSYIVLIFIEDIE